MSSFVKLSVESVKQQEKESQAMWVEESEAQNDKEYIQVHVLWDRSCSPSVAF